MQLIIGYHSLFDSHSSIFLQDQNSQYNIDFETFKKQIEYVRYACRDVSYLVTFDDGYNSDLRASEYLDCNECIFFVNPSNLDQHNYLTKEQLIKISNKHLIGSHSYNHVNLKYVNPKIAYHEMNSSKIFLEELLNKTIDSIALPNGGYNDETIKIAYEVGYKKIYLTDIYNIGTNESDILSRILIKRDYSFDEFKDIINTFGLSLKTKRTMRNIEKIIMGNQFCIDDINSENLGSYFIITSSIKTELYKILKNKRIDYTNIEIVLFLTKQFRKRYLLK